MNRIWLALLSPLWKGSVRVESGGHADDGDACLPPFVKGDRGGFNAGRSAQALEKSPLSPLYERGESHFLADSAHPSLSRTEPLEKGGETMASEA